MKKAVTFRETESFCFFFAYSETTFNLVSYTLEIGDSFEFGRG